MGILFNFLLVYFKDQLAFEQNMKSFYLILSVMLGLLIYLFISYCIKAFKISDFKLNY
jgi:putative peptidoglycan lipid II flippase